MSWLYLCSPFPVVLPNKAKLQVEGQVIQLNQLCKMMQLKAKGCQPELGSLVLSFPLTRHGLTMD